MRTKNLIPTVHFYKRCKKRGINADSFLKNCRLKWDMKTDQVKAIYKGLYSPVIPKPDGYILATVYKMSDAEHRKKIRASKRLNGNRFKESSKRKVL